MERYNTTERIDLENPFALIRELSNAELIAWTAKVNGQEIRARKKWSKANGIWRRLLLWIEPRLQSEFGREKVGMQSHQWGNVRLWNPDDEQERREYEAIKTDELFDSILRPGRAYEKRFFDLTFALMRLESDNKATIEDVDPKLLRAYLDAE